MTPHEWTSMCEEDAPPHKLCWCTAHKHEAYNKTKQCEQTKHQEKHKASAVECMSECVNGCARVYGCAGMRVYGIHV